MNMQYHRKVRDYHLLLANRLMFNCHATKIKRLMFYAENITETSKLVFFLMQQYLSHKILCLIWNDKATCLQ